MGISTCYVQFVDITYSLQQFVDIAFCDWSHFTVNANWL